MALIISASITEQDALRKLAKKLDEVSFKERGSLVSDYAKMYGNSNATIYRKLKSIGWESGRKTRTDKGTTSQCEDTLNEMCAVQKLGVRKNGKITMQTPNARSLLSANGRKFKVGNARLNTLLSERGMNVNQQKQDRACQQLRSLHPNHVHLVDPSLCLIYYLKDGSQHIMGDDEFYKNKPENLERIENLKVWRYVLTDHYSNTIIVRYYQSKGETQANLFDFLLYCWKRIDDRLFHGVPKILYWDKGSANTSKAIKFATELLDIVTIAHIAGNARAKGSVEGANNTVEKLMESRLRYEPVNNVDELNAMAEGWYNAYNSNSIPDYDSRLKRRFMKEPQARYALWQIIRKDQLRLLPDEEICRYLLTVEPIERKVMADLSVSFRHPVSKKREYYDVSHLPEVFPNAFVKVAPLIYGNHEVMIYAENYKGEETTYIVEPIERDEFSGFRLDGAIIGEEMKSKPDTIIETAGKEADRIAFPNKTLEEIDKLKRKNAVPFNGELDALSHLKDVEQPAFMKRPGSEMTLPDQYSFDEKPLTHIEACKRLIAELNRSLTPDENSLVRELYPDGIPNDEFNNLLLKINSPEPSFKLKVVT